MASERKGARQNCRAPVRERDRAAYRAVAVMLIVPSAYCEACSGSIAIPTVISSPPLSPYSSMNVTSRLSLPWAFVTVTVAGSEVSTLSLSQKSGGAMSSCDDSS